MALLAANRLGIGDGAVAAARSLVTATAPAGAPLALAGLAEARAAFVTMDSALRHGDWASFGRAYDALRRALEARSPRGPRP
jgi:hypothetical protein